MTAAVLAFSPYEPGAVDPASIAWLADATGTPTAQGLGAWLAWYAKGPARLTLACSQGRPAGAIGIETMAADETTIRHIAVAPDVRRQGVGRALVRHACQAGAAAVVAAETDADGVGFDRSLGFEVRSLGERFPGVERFAVRLARAAGRGARGVA